MSTFTRERADVLFLGVGTGVHRAVWKVPMRAGLRCCKLSAFAVVLLALGTGRAAAQEVAAEAASGDGALRVVVTGSPPFVIEASDGSISGLSPETWRAAARRLDWDYELSAVDGVGDALAAVEAEHADVAVGPISITAPRARRIDFTQPYFQAGLAILAPRSESLLQHVRPFLTRTFLAGLGLLIAVLAGVGTLAWLAERRRNAGEFPTAPLQGIGNGIWYALVTMTTVGYGDRVARSVAGRIVTSIWMLVSMVAVSSLTAFMATALTLSQMERPAIASAGDLVEAKVATVAGTTSVAFSSKKGARVVEEADLGAAVQALNEGRVQAVVFDRPMLRYVLSQRSDLDMRLSEASYQHQGYGFALRRGSELRSPLDVALLRLVSDGTVEELARHWLGP